MDLIRRNVEARAEGRTIRGPVLVYGDISPSHRERFLPGSVVMAEAVPLNLRHDKLVAVAWSPGGGLNLEDDETSLRMTADLPPLPAADVALERIRAAAGTMGLSVEFKSLKERKEGGIRIIEKAELRGIGIIERPSYPRSRVEARGGQHRIPLWL